MRSKEFTKESAIDDLSAQMQAQQQQKNQAKANTPYNQSAVGNWIGGKSTNPIARAINPTSAVNTLGGVAGGLNNALKIGAQGGLGGVDVAYKGSPDQLADPTLGAKTAPAGNQSIDYVPGKIDAHVADYLTKAAKGQPAKYTGNVEIDKILKAAGILK
jgi:hypothetical protein